LVSEDRTIAKSSTPSSSDRERALPAFFNRPEDRPGFFELAVQASPSGLLVVRRDGLVEFANAQARNILGYGADELVGLHIDRLVPDRFRAGHPVNRANYLVHPTTRPMGAGRDLYALRKDGTEIPVEIGLNPIHGAGDGQVLVSIVDITERRRAEDRFRTALEAAPSGIIMVDGEGLIVLVNSQVEEIFGYSSEELVGKSIGILLPDDVEQSHPAMRASYMVNPTKRPMGAGRNLHGRRKDGSLVPLEIGLNPHRAGDDCFVLASIVDISARLAAEETNQRLRAERRVEHAQRLESLGILAGGLAHDFNNLLVAMLGYCELALTEVAPETSIARHLGAIREAALSASELTKQMLAYSGKGKVFVRFTSLNDSTRRIRTLLRASMSKRATVKMYLDDAIPEIVADERQIQQIVMNLLTNASDAVDERSGVITVRTGVASLTSAAADDYIFASSQPAGRYVYLEVSDTGVGMTDAVKRQMFDPFFSTKFQGRGLGMAAVHGILRAHNGGIRVQSTPDLGTTVRVVFPVPNPDLDAEPPSDESRLTVMIVDDEPSVRGLLRKVLEKLGFAAVCHADGESCLKALQRSDLRASLVILDLTMPGIDGRETLRRMRAMGLDMPVILTSGYPEHAALSEISRDAAVHFLPKPFTQSVLKHMLHEVLPNQPW
jgi:PAS domain S-box-containing protein